MIRLAAALLVVAGCLGNDVVVCGDGELCAPGTACVVVHDPDVELCADEAALAACDDKAEYTHCGSNGRCYSGVCLPVACGNGRVDRADPDDPGDTGEVCDDGNQIAGDGCSADCTSNETCGNGVVDPIKGELCDDGNAIQHDGCSSACTPESPHWVQLSTQGPSARTGAAMAYDAARDRVVLFGGNDATTYAQLGDTWEWDGVAWHPFAPPVSPSPRSDLAMAYDAARHEVVLFGGYDSAPTADTWEWDGSTWTPRAVLRAPAARSSHSMTYDAVRGRVVMYGGQGKSVGLIRPFTDTWEWDGTSWTQQVTTQDPGVRQAAGFAFDPDHGVAVMFGGNSSDVETWTYDGDWHVVANSGPPPRDQTAMAADLAHHCVELVGGRDASDNTLGDAWRWDGSAWTQAPDAPLAVSDLSLATDARHGPLVLFGGVPPDGTTPSASTWQSTELGWRELTATAMPTMESPGAAYDEQAGATVLFGAAPVGSPDPSATWTFDGGWAQADAYPIPAESSMMAYDEARAQTVLFTGDGALRSTWLFADGDWTSAATATVPPPRADAALAYDAHQRVVILFGGESHDSDHNFIALGDTWSWDGTTWTQLAPAHVPSARFDAAIARDPIRDEIVMFGGGAADGSMLAETWGWTGSDWTERTPANSPPATVGCRLAWDAARRRLVLFGGKVGVNMVSATWEWDGQTWAPIAVVAQPAARSEHALFPSVDGAGVVAFGGDDGASGRGLSDMWLLRWDGSDTDQSCEDGLDGDGDGLVGCADPDCWATCTPACPPATSCNPAAPHCGDGVCNPGVEDCASCPADCMCAATCGDFACDPGETAASCPGDCH